MALKLYISQANQAHNAGPDGYTERAGMDAISKKLGEVFAKDNRFTVKRNSAAGVDTAVANCAEANAWGADRYLALHSNAGQKGTVAFYHSASSRGKRLAEAIYAAVAGLSPGPEAGHQVKTMDGFIEIHTPHAPAVLVELEAHDWRTGVEWLTGERDEIARALYAGVCRGVGLDPIAVKPKRIALTDQDINAPRQHRPHRAGWWNLGLMPYIDQVREQGDDKRVRTGNPDYLIIPVPETRPAWWADLMRWKKACR